MEKQYGSGAEKQKAYRERKRLEREQVGTGGEFQPGYDANGLILVRYDCPLCKQWWSASGFYSGACPYCGKGHYAGSLAEAEDTA